RFPLQIRSTVRRWDHKEEASGPLFLCLEFGLPGPKPNVAGASTSHDALSLSFAVITVLTFQ
ncbi:MULTISPECIES: hypothetical protein, partial [unclassified Pseudomonas]|uniref:hypothetical protein n=1 Tax=unclassified Pseudomonas TaxID=196821 RepID=UPI00257A682E